MSEHPAYRRFYGRRALLNLPGRGAKLKPGCDIEPRVLLQIANCDRSILFACSMENEREQANTLHKVDTLIDALTAFREGLVIEHARYNERKAITKTMKRKK